MRQDRLIERPTAIGDEYSFRNKAARAAWGAIYFLLIRPSPRPFHAWRSALYRAFGAKLGDNCRIYPGAKVWAPWNIECGSNVAIADGVEIYNPISVTIGAGAIISQGAYLCCAEHNSDVPGFPLVLGSIRIGEEAWIAARSCVLPGVHVGDGAVLALGAIATCDLQPWAVYGGIPAKVIRERSYRGPSSSR